MWIAIARSLQHRIVARVSLGAVLALAACSAGTADGTDPPPASSVNPPAPTAPAPTGGSTVAADGAASPVTTATAPTTSADDAPASTDAVDVDGPESPLREYLGAGSAGADTGFDPAAAERETRAHEEAIARCMTAEGFEYVPFVRPFQWTVVEGGAAVINVGSGELPDLPPDEFAAQYGYGLSTRPPGDTADPDADPNAAIVDAMSVAERVAYYGALLGAGQSLDGEGRPDAEMPGDPASCWERAATEVWGDQRSAPVADPVRDAFASLLEQVAAIADQVAADPRLVAANATWSACMADAGFPGYSDLNAPQSDVAGRARTVMGTSMDQANADPDQLAELQRFEISIATADHACRQGYGDVYQEVRDDLERRFVEQHRTELEQYRDAVAAQAG